MATITGLCITVLAFALLAASVSSLQPTVFNVGDEKGWTVPSGNGTESYNHWAKRNRFQVGDILEFKYTNDSVLVVSHNDYKQCNTEAPLNRFTDGDTRFPFDRFGPFYFVSGVPGHCEAGQRMIVRVMAPSSLTGTPSAAPGMPPTAGPTGAPSPSSSSSYSPVNAAPPSGSSPSPLPASSGASALSAFSSIVLTAVAVMSLLVLA